MQHKSNNSCGNPQNHPKREDYKNDDEYLSACIAYNLVLVKAQTELVKKHCELTDQFISRNSAKAEESSKKAQLQSKELKRLIKKAQLQAKKDRIKAMQKASLELFQDLKLISYNETIKKTNLELGRIHTN